MLLHRDASVQLYGMHAWACLFPWDPMAMDFPERVTPLLEEEFMSQWVEEDDPAQPSLVGDVPRGSRDLGPTTNGDRSARSARSRGNGGAVPGKRRVANAKARAEEAEREQQTVEAELQAATQRRHGFETWAMLVEQKLRMAQVGLDRAAAAARAAESRQSEIQGRLDAAREAVQLTGTEAQAARKRVEAAGRSIRVARSVRRMRRLEEELQAAVVAVDEARLRERKAAEELAGQQSTLDRALLKIADATKAEAALQRLVTNARRKAARASLTLASLMGQIEDASKSARQPGAEVVPLVTDVEQAEEDAREARAELVAAAAEVRSVAEMGVTSELRAKEARAVLLEAHREVRRADALVRECEAAVAEAEQRMAKVQPSLVEAQADAQASADRVAAAGRSVRFGRHVWRLSRARRKVQKHTSLLEVVRREAEEAHAHLEMATAEAQEASNQVKQGRGVEAEARRGLGDAHRRLGRAVATLSRLRWEAGAGGEGSEETFQYLVIARQRAVLGSLSLDEWARRAPGHWRIPRFILELDGEALWLYRGEWVVADPALTLDDLTVLEDEPLGTEDTGIEIIEHGHSLELDAVQFTWERDGGRCTKCGSFANLAIDHVIPSYLGGGDAASNLQLLCRNCAREKSHRL